VKKDDLVVAAVLSGNRNFEGRINPQVKANYLASPPLVVAYALAGRVDFDMDSDSLGNGTDGKPVYLRDIWPTPQEVDAGDRAPSPPRCSARNTRRLSRATATGSICRSRPATFCWDDASTYIKKPPYFDNMTDPNRPSPISPACACWRCWAIRSPPITFRPPDRLRQQPGRKVSDRAQGVKPKDFNSYGARRGNHEVMVRGTLANVRLRNQLAPGTEGGWTVHLPDGEQMFIYDASMRYQAGRRAAADHRGQGIRFRIVARLGGEGRAAAGREGGDRGELRAHPPDEPGRDGRAAAAPSGRRRLSPRSSRSSLELSYFRPPSRHSKFA
jgi:aconitate hydratase